LKIFFGNEKNSFLVHVSFFDFDQFVFSLQLQALFFSAKKLFCPIFLFSKIVE